MIYWIGLLLWMIGWMITAARIHDLGMMIGPFFIAMAIMVWIVEIRRKL